MTVGVLSTTFVLAVLLHNAEEAIFLPAWSQHAARWHRPVGRSEFRFAVTALSLLLVVVAAFAIHQGPNSLSAYLFFGYVFAMTANAIVPHLAATLALRRYMPGTASGLLLNLPIGIYLLHEAVVQRWVAPSSLLWVAPAVGIALAASIPLFLAVGRLLSSTSNRPA